MTASLAGAALVLGACGSNDEGKPIPHSERLALESRLTEIQRRFDNGTPGACRDIENDSEPAVRRILASTPHSVGSDVRNALDDSFNRLFDLVRSDCANQEPTQTQTIETTPPETQTVITVPPTPTQTQTQPTQTQTQEQKQPKQDKKGNGAGGGAEAPGVVLPKKGKK